MPCAPPFAPDEFRRARDLFESALDWPPDDRARLIREACGEDTALVAMVEAMLQADAAPHALLDGSPAMPSAMAGGSAGDRPARFRREPHVLASLNHPNVAAIHGVEEADGVRALVLELVEGQTRAARLADGPLPLGDVVAIARQIAVGLEVEDVENDIWVWHFERETLARVTTDPGLDESPVWTRDGRRIVFTSEAGGVMGSLCWQSADRSGRAEAIGDGTRIQRPSAITTDGARVLFSEGTGLLSMSLDGRRDVQTPVRLPQSGGDGAISPDGRWLAYVEVGSDSPQVFVSPFAAPDQDRVQVTPAGGTQPRWSASGREPALRSRSDGPGAFSTRPTSTGSRSPGREPTMSPATGSDS